MKVNSEISSNHVAAEIAAIPLQQLIAFRFHWDRQVRRQVAENPRMPAEYLADLANDDFYEVRISVSENMATPIPILELLSEDDHPDVRFAMAENANTPTHILKILLHDENPYVSSRARETLTRLEQVQVTSKRLRYCA
jgi:hypothetical protein